MNTYGKGFMESKFGNDFSDKEKQINVKILKVSYIERYYSESKMTTHRKIKKYLQIMYLIRSPECIKTSYNSTTNTYSPIQK